MDWERQRDLVLATGTLRLTDLMLIGYVDVFDTDVCLLDKEDCFDEVEALADVFPTITTLVFNGFGMTQLPDIVSRATSLTSLSLCWCANLTALPSTLPPTLASLDIYMCNALRCLHLPPLKSLKVYAPFSQVNVLPMAQLDMLPSSVNDSMPAVDDACLELSAVDYCCTIPPSSWKWLQNARMLTELTLHMHNMTACPIVVPVTCRVLELESCYDVVDFNTLFPEHCGLEKLRLTDAAIVTSLPDSIGWLERLQHLELQRFNVLTQLPASCGRLAALTVLEIAWCPLTVLPTLPASLVRLELMAVSISVFPPLDTLRHLEVRQCGAVQELPAHMPLLHTLRLSANEALRHVHVSHYGELRVLSVIDARGTEVLGLEVLGLQDVVLQELTLSSIRNESVLPSVLPTLRHLTKLTLRACQTLSCLPAIRAPALEALSIERWPRLATIPACFGDLSALRTLSIRKCPALTAWPASDGRLQCLTDLSLQRVGLHAWPDVLRDATRLQCLKMVHCDNLADEALPIWIGSVPDLKADRAIVWRYRYSVAQSILALLVTSRRRPNAKLPPELWYYVKNFIDLML